MKFIVYACGAVAAIVFSLISPGAIAAPDEIQAYTMRAWSITASTGRFTTRCRTMSAPITSTA